MPRLIQTWLLPLLAAFGAVSCGKETANKEETSSKGRGRPVVVTTTTMITDLVRTIGGDNFDIQPLMGPGVDPHLFTATNDVLKKLQRADAIIYNGLHLEGRMVDTFKSMKQLGRKVLAIGEKLPEEELLSAGGDFDPHIWGDARLWSKTIQPVKDFLFSLNSGAREDMERRSVALLTQLSDAHEWLRRQVDRLPDNQRVLVTSHDAFRYFGRAYGLQVLSVQGISTDSEASISDVLRVVDRVKAARVNAIFVESSVPAATIQRISKDSGAKVGGELLGDALGVPGDIEDIGEGMKVDRGTVTGMLKSNMHRIIKGLMP